MSERISGIGMTSQRTRMRMIERLREQGIVNEAVLNVMNEVPRHIFVEDALASRAYEDFALPLGFGVTVSGKVTGMPIVGVVGEGAPTEMLGAPFTLIVTDALGAVVAVEPVPVDAAETPAVAVTLAVLFVVICVVAVPVPSVFAIDALRLPLSVVKVTGTPGSRLPLESKTFAVSVDVPPLAETVPGDALTPMFAAAAAPIAILIALVPLAETPPEMAVIVAVPEPVPAVNFTVALPLMSVSAWDG